ncbi:MAG: cytochrome c-type biogenesis protein [Pseudomonadota bacterium]|jgi:cytochrome c-type biogenesis protein CcmH
MGMTPWRWFLAVLLLGIGLAAGAVEPDEMLADPALEARARAISQNLRCLVCQNQSIDDSNADLAKDLRLLVRQRLLAGDSDQQVIGYIVARYGDFVLLRPPLKPATYVLWLAPPVVLLLGLWMAIRWYRRQARQAPAAAPLTPAEEAEAARLIEELRQP